MTGRVAILGFVIVSILPAQSGKHVQQSAFDVIGLAARTTNVDEAGPNGVIPRLWQRLMSQNLPAKIPNRIGDDIVAVYTEYTSDENGAYTYVVGVKVKPGTDAPEGMRKVRIPASEYIVFPTLRGPVEQVVPAEWHVIWKAFTADGPFQRAFSYDFELYGKTAADPKNSQVDIYIGIK